MQSRRVLWSVVPEQTSSPYVRDIVGSLRGSGWTVEPLSLQRLLSSTNEIVHIQWPEHVSRGASTPATLAKHLRTAPLLGALQARGHCVVVTAHNRAPHGTSDAVDSWFRSQLLTRADTIVVLVPGHGTELQAASAGGTHTEFRTIPHPIHAPESPIDQQETRDLLIVLGQIHPYHLIEEFLDGFDPEQCSVDVLVAGGVGDAELVDRLENRARTNDWLTVMPGFADEATLQPHLRRCAAIVSLQHNTFNSGGPFFALPRNIPIVMSAGAQADDLIATVGPEWVFPVTDPRSLDCVALHGWLRGGREQPTLERFSLEAITAAHIELYELLRS